MARMFPDTLPSKASKGEDRVFAILKNLPDDCIVYYEPEYRRGGQTQRPDFIVIMPNVGVLVIEVKGWDPGEIQSATTDVVTTKIRGHVEPHRHPLRQANDYMFALMDRAREYARSHPAVQRLFHSQGERAGKFLFPFASLAYLHNISREQLTRTGAGDVDAIFGRPSNLMRDEIRDFEGLDSAELVSRLKSAFKPWWPFERMDADQLQVLRAIIYPELRINAADLKTLDDRQAQHALSMGSGHRIVYGVAGSGKTIILIARVRRLLAIDPETRILVLCYNRALASHFRSRFADIKRNVTVRHFHAWGGRHGVKFDEAEDKESYGVRLLDRLENSQGDARTYDAVVIDEGQDFAKSWLQCAKSALKDPHDGDLIVVGDGSQSLYRRRPFTWKEAGLGVVGRAINKAYDLDKNYRNTRPIIRCALPFSKAPERDGDDFASKAMTVSVDDAVRDGVAPRILVAPDKNAECDLIVSEIRQWLEHGLPTVGGGLNEPIKPHDIGVLYPRLEKRDAAVMTRFIETMQTFVPVMWWNRPGSGDLQEPGIRLQTIHSARGLQYRAVIVMWADLLPSRSDPDQVELERRLLYVALTRAEDVLLITRSRSSTFTDILEQTIEQTSG